MGRKVKVLNLRVDTFGHYLGLKKGCIYLLDRNKQEQKFPLSECEVGEVVLTSGNTVSVDALSMLSLWGLDILIATHSGKPIAILKNLADDSHVATRVKQYESLNNGKGTAIAKEIIIAKMMGQNLLLKKYGMRLHDSLKIKEKIEALDSTNLKLLSSQLRNIEGRYSMNYLYQVFMLFPKELRPDRRRGFQAYDEVNNLFNLAYEQLFAKCYMALTKAHLETHLGYIHSLLFKRPSLVCDFVELYRYSRSLLNSYTKHLKVNDLEEAKGMFNDKKGKRMFLTRPSLNELLNGLHDYFRSQVIVPRRNRGSKQEFESLINEEAMILAKFLRGERDIWNPRLPSFSVQSSVVKPSSKPSSALRIKF